MHTRQPYTLGEITQLYLKLRRMLVYGSGMKNFDWEMILKEKEKLDGFCCRLHPRTARGIQRCFVFCALQIS